MEETRIETRRAIILIITIVEKITKKSSSNNKSNNSSNKMSNGNFKLLSTNIELEDYIVVNKNNDWDKDSTEDHIDDESDIKEKFCKYCQADIFHTRFIPHNKKEWKNFKNDHSDFIYNNNSNEELIIGLQDRTYDDISNYEENNNCYTPGLQERTWYVSSSGKENNGSSMTELKDRYLVTSNSNKNSSDEREEEHYSDKTKDTEAKT